MRCGRFTNRQQDTETTLFQQYQENQDSLLLLHIKKSAKPLEQSSIKSLSLFLFLLKLIYHIDRITKFPLKKLLTQSVKNKKSGLSIFLFFYFSFLFSFRFIFLYSIFRTRVRVRVTRSHCHTTGHIRRHGHKSHNT